MRRCPPRGTQRRGPSEGGCWCTHWKDHLHPLTHGDHEAVPPELEVGFDPQEALTHRDENSDMLNPIAGQMLQLDLVVAQ